MRATSADGEVHPVGVERDVTGDRRHGRRGVRVAPHRVGLLRAARLPSAQQERLASSPAMELWEYLGARWYRAARELAPAATARIVVVGDVAGRFQQARRVLNHLADRYLLSSDQPWFEQPSF